MLIPDQGKKTLPLSKIPHTNCPFILVALWPSLFGKKKKVAPLYEAN